MNRSLRDAEFKDEHPLKTVERIRGILSGYGIETEEVWLETGVPYCYGIRIQVVGTTFSANGKGLTKAFALASGYGELMERLQLGYIGRVDVQKDGHHALGNTNTEQISAEELFSKNEDWYCKLAALLHRYTGVQEHPKMLVEQYADTNGLVDTIPFYNVMKGTKENFPAKLVNSVYSANGCAAGNSMEEALVQGISEVVERHYHMRIVTEQITLPDIPEDVLKRYRVAYEIISFVRAVGYRVIVKDCSLGTRFPVVCVCFINQRTGRYHTHFGAYPVFEIALERALTETFQGRNIYSFASFTDFVYRESDITSVTSIANEMTKGTWEKHSGFFVGKPKYPYHEDVGFTGCNNAELLRECVDFFAKQGYEILVRDSSCLGFHTYQILVPGYSEVFIYRLSREVDDHRYFHHSVKALRDPSKASTENMNGLLKHLEEMGKLTQNISHVHGFLSCAKLSAKLSASEENQLMSASMAYIWYSLGNVEACIENLSRIIPGKNDKDTEYLICLKRYLSLKQHGYNEDEVRRTIAFFHRAETVDNLLKCIEQGGNPLERFTLHCDLSCTSACKLHTVCCQKRIGELASLIAARKQEMDFDAFCRQLKDITSC